MLVRCLPRGGLGAPSPSLTYKLELKYYSFVMAVQQVKRKSEVNEHLGTVFTVKAFTSVSFILTWSHDQPGSLGPSDGFFD